MLAPIYLGLCRAADLDKGHEAAGTLMNANLGMAVLVSVVHATAMIAAGGCSAWLVYRYLGLKFVSRSWFNLGFVLGRQPHSGGSYCTGVALPKRRLLTLLMKMARAYELAARQQAYPHILYQSDARATSRLVPGGPGAALRAVGDWRHPAARRERISFDEVAEAHRRLEAGGLEGKLVLCPDLPPRRGRAPLKASLPRNAACSKVEIVAALCSARV